jgi:anti-anti-sigma factor
MTTATLSGWKLQVERGPDWLFIRPQPPHGREHLEVELADGLWQTMEEHMTHRLVLDMTDVNLLRSWLIGQLVNLHKRIATHDGMLRLCNLSKENQETLHVCQLHNQFPTYDNRYTAVMGERAKPR